MLDVNMSERVNLSSFIETLAKQDMIDVILNVFNRINFPKELIESRKPNAW